jgi:hypothetical protein
VRTIRKLYDHADRYRRLYIQGVPRALSIADDEHRKILAVLTHHAPEHDPTTVGVAIRLATGVVPPFTDRSAVRRSPTAAQVPPLNLLLPRGVTRGVIHVDELISAKSQPH